MTVVAAGTVEPSTIAPRSKRWRWGWLLELVGMLAMYELYDFGRDRVVGRTAAAFAHARDIIAAERWLGIYVERSVQQAFLNLDWFITFWNIYYGTTHFVFPVITLVWMYRKAPARYVRWRNTLVAMWTIAVVTFLAYPLMPPRLMPPRYGYVDTAARYYNFGPQVKVEYGSDGQPTQRALAQYGNPFAAMPSFHVGWSSWCLLGLWPLARRRRWLKGVLVAYVLGVIFCITVTANHWLVDSIGGWLVLALGYATAVVIERVGGAIRRARGEGSTARARETAADAAG